MTSAVPTTTTEFIERQLDQRITLIEECFEADGLSMTGPLYHGVDDLTRSLVEHIRLQSTRPRLVVLLTTLGGVIEPVQRIVETLRHHYDHVIFVIPNYAFSAGTVLAMSGDEIVMDYYSRLGPIDPQIETANGRVAPALGYLKQWERLLEKAQKGQLTTVEAQLMLTAFDQAELYMFEQARELSVSLLTEWLAKYKFKDWITTETRQIPVTDDMRQKRAEDIARELNNTDRWHSHGYGISMEVLRRDLNLKIDDLDDHPARRDRIKQYHSLLSDYLQQRQHQGMLHARGTFLPYS